MKQLGGEQEKERESRGRNIHRLTSRTVLLSASATNNLPAKAAMPVGSAKADCDDSYVCIQRRRGRQDTRLDEYGVAVVPNDDDPPPFPPRPLFLLCCWGCLKLEQMLDLHH